LESIRQEWEQALRHEQSSPEHVRLLQQEIVFRCQAAGSIPSSERPFYYFAVLEAHDSSSQARQGTLPDRAMIHTGKQAFQEVSQRSSFVMADEIDQGKQYQTVARALAISEWGTEAGDSEEWNILWNALWELFLPEGSMGDWERMSWRAYLTYRTTHLMARFFFPHLLGSQPWNEAVWQALLQFQSPACSRGIQSRPAVLACCEDSQTVWQLWDCWLLDPTPLHPLFWSAALAIFYQEEIRQGRVGQFKIQGQLQLEFLHESAKRLQHNLPQSVIRSLEEAHAGKKCSTIHPRTGCFFVSSGEISSHIYLQDGLPSEEENMISFLVLDCRPWEAFHRGHIPRALHLSFATLQEDPEAFEQALATIRATQKEKSSTCVLVGSGRDGEEDELEALLLFLWQRDIPKMTILRGGYRTFHQAAMQHDLPLRDHQTSQCDLCQPSLVAMRQFFENTRDRGLHLLDQGGDLLAQVADSIELDEPTSEPESNIIHNPQLKEMLFSRDNAYFPCQRMTPERHPLIAEPGMVLIAKDLLVWLEHGKFDVDPESGKRKTVEFGFSFAFHLTRLRRISLNPEGTKVRFLFASTGPGEEQAEDRVEMFLFPDGQAMAFVEILRAVRT